jgi:hypothetical protein
VRQQRNILGKTFTIVQLSRLQRQAVGKPHIVTAATDCKLKYAVLVAIVSKLAFPINGQVRTTVVSVTNKSVAIDLAFRTGLPGVCSLICEARILHVQDYSNDVFDARCHAPMIVIS